MQLMPTAKHFYFAEISKELPTQFERPSVGDDGEKTKEKKKQNRKKAENSKR